jgi:uncharacterized membrane protein YphA (DoxX/SURF4 family)
VPKQVSIAGRTVDARWVTTGLRLAVGAVFLFSGFSKVVDITLTTRSVRAYDLLPEAIVPTVGAGLPVLELALAALLLTGLLIRPAAVVTTVICAAFFIGVASAWARGLTIQCGCFGNGGQAPHPVPGYIRELVLNSLMILACSWLIRRPASRFSLDTGLGLRAELPDDLDFPDDVDASDDPDDSNHPPIGVQQ